MTHTDADRLSAWGPLLTVFNGDVDRARAAWNHNPTLSRLGPPPTFEDDTARSNEKDLMGAIVKALRGRGYLVWHSDAGSAVSSRKGAMGRPPIGWPDLMVFGENALFTLLEVKTATGTVSREQSAMHSRLKKMGHMVAVVRSEAQALEAVCGAFEGVRE